AAAHERARPCQSSDRTAPGAEKNFSSETVRARRRERRSPARARVAEPAPFVHLRRTTMPDSAVVSRPERPDSSAFRRRLPIGAEVMSDGRTHVRLWAPLAGRVDCVVTSRAEAQSTALMREAGEDFSGIVDARAGDR